MYNKDCKVTMYSQENSRIVEKTDSIVDSLIDKFIDRATLGKKKYGTTLDRQDLSLEEWLDHAIEESMDHALYLMKIKSILSGKKGSN